MGTFLVSAANLCKLRQCFNSAMHDGHGFLSFPRPFPFDLCSLSLKCLRRYLECRSRQIYFLKVSWLVQIIFLFFVRILFSIMIFLHFLLFLFPFSPWKKCNFLVLLMIFEGISFRSRWTSRAISPLQWAPFVFATRLDFNFNYLPR